MIQVFLEGGPLMWPLLLVSIVTMAVAAERLWFLFSENRLRRPQDVEAFFVSLERGDKAAALALGAQSTDFVVRVLTYAAGHAQVSLSNAYLQAAGRELRRFERGLPVLDTAITLAPLLGLLGTVTGLIHAFGILGGELEAPAALTGGIAQALIATAFGMLIAIAALLPFNFLNAKAEQARHELEDVGTQMELLLRQKAA